MKRKILSILLIIVMVACFAGALSYPIQYYLQKGNNETDMDKLREMRRSVLEDSTDRAQKEQTDAVSAEPTAEATENPTGGSALLEAAVGDSDKENDPTPKPEIIGENGAEPGKTGKEPDETVPDVTLNGAETATEKPEPTPAAAEEPQPEETDRHYREDDALPYISKEKVELDPDLILPQYRDIYEQNNDMVGWLSVPGTKIDYPVLQSEEHDYYLRRDFYGEENKNGQLILDSSCDPWTPSYNLVITGHNMKSGDMFGTLMYYMYRSFWNNHKTFTFDSLMREGTYVVFAAFYSADYDVDEEGFRYNANIEYKLDAELWLEEVWENSEYDTGIDVQFGDEILTLTTCMYHRENGRFVVVARRVREGEVIE